MGDEPERNEWQMSLEGREGVTPDSSYGAASPSYADQSIAIRKGA